MPAPNWRRWTFDIFVAARVSRRDVRCPVVSLLHPATFLLAWGALVAVLQSLALAPLGWVAAVVVPLTLLLARRRCLLLFRRARWLLLSIALLFALSTPGQHLPGVAGDLGVTLDGLRLAAEHILRLLLLLASLAAVHEHLGTSGMMAGLYWLLAPIARWRTFRERIVVRLMLVLDHVENSSPAPWREWLEHDLPGPDRLSLAVGEMRVADWSALTLLTVLVVLMGALA